MYNLKLSVRTDSGNKFDKTFKETDMTLQNLIDKTKQDLESGFVVIEGSYIVSSKIESFYIEDMTEEGIQMNKSIDFMNSLDF